MEKAALEGDEIADERVKSASGSAVAPSPKKRKTAAVVDAGASGAASLPNDVVRSIFARLPACTTVACTALLKHHGGLIRSSDFRALHCRLGAPLPSPHIAYLATAPIRRRPEQKYPASWFYGFHVAGGSGLGGGGSAPMRALIGWRYLGTKYINTCNGVVLLASEGFFDICRCTLWNPAVADVTREVAVTGPSPESECLVLGLGYGRRSKTYKLLLCRKDTHPTVRYARGGRIRISGGPTHRFEYSLVVQLLGDDAGEQTPPLRTVLSVGVDGEFKQKSLYMDGTIYLQLEKPAILAFEVDNETVSQIDIPGEHQDDRRLSHELIEMSGRPYMVKIGSRCIELWLLTPDHQWEQMCVISPKHNIYYSSIVCVWHCGGVLVLYFECSIDEVFLYNVAMKKLFKADAPGDLLVDRSDYELAWGYKPTLVSPGSIVGEINQDLVQRRNRSSHITEVINPLFSQDRGKGQEATLNTVCLMEFLVRIMQKLPDGLQDVVEMPTMDSDDPDCLFESIMCQD
ncbi:unnamed protein product [Urochloa humidicola]